MKGHSTACWMHRHSEQPSGPEHCRLFEGDLSHSVPMCQECHGGFRHQGQGGEPSAIMPASKRRSTAKGAAVHRHHVLHYSWCSRTPTSRLAVMFKIRPFHA